MEENKLKNKKVSEPTCPVCKAEDTSFSFEVDGFDVWQCGHCSGSFIGKMPTERELKNYYDDPNWFESGLKGGYESYDRQTEGTIPFVEGVLASVAKDNTYKSVLDIGCGYGTHLGVAQKYGWECFGVEISDHARQIAIERHGDYAFIKSTVTELIPHKFDLILMLDVIEHLPDPYVIFYELFAKGAIRKDTTVIVTTPNAQSMDAITKREAWQYMHPPSHLIYYSAESIYQFFNHLKFKNIEISGQYKTDQSVTSDYTTGYSRNDSIIENVALISKVSGSDFTQFMQERYVPGTWSILAEYEHMPRYMFAKKYSAGKKILDFGCGTGYGSKILSEVAVDVTSLDIDKEALQWARPTHKADNLDFIRSETLGEELASNSFDTIINFEMIEHVDQQLQKKCLKQFSRLLKDDGLLIISTPNPDVTAEYGENPYHIHEMPKDEFEMFLKEAFEHVVILEQFINLTVVIQGQHSKLDKTLNGQGRAVAFIALASNSKIKDFKGMEYIDYEYDFVGEELNKAEALKRSNIEAYTYFSTIKDIHAELHQIHQSRIFRLMNTWTVAPFGLRKIFKLSYLVGGGLLPVRIKGILLPIIQKLRRKIVRIVTLLQFLR